MHAIIRAGWSLGVSESAALGMIVAAAAASGGLAFLEWRRPGRMRVVRAVAAVAAVAALLVIALRPARSEPAAAAGAVVLTPGARVVPRGPAYVIGASASRATAIPDLAWLARHRADLARVTVLGWGLGEEQWPQHDGAALPFAVEASLTPPPRGISAIAWPPSITFGSDAVIRGRVRGAAKGAWLVLGDASGHLDSARVSGDDAAFTLRARPRAAGHWHPTLSFAAPAAGEPESLAIDVRPPAPLRVLLVDGSPSFDSRFLRDWLAARGAAVTTRTTVSRRRTRLAVVNPPAVTVLDRATLDRLDVIVLRATALSVLARRERRAIAAAVTEAGTGLVVISDSVLASAPSGDALALSSAVTTAGATAGGDRPARLMWDEVRRTATVSLAPAVLRESFGSRVLVRDAAGRGVVNVTPLGIGRIAVSLVVNSAGWKLGGENESYAAFWSRVFDAVRAPAREDTAWSGIGGPHFVDRPVAMVATASSGVSRAVIEGPGGRIDTIAMAAAADDSGRSRGVFWPPEPGWYRLGGMDGIGLFVYDETRWAALGVQRRIEATLARVGAAAPRAQGMHRVPLALWPAFALFVAAAGFLWAPRAQRPPPRHSGRR